MKFFKRLWWHFSLWRATKLLRVLKWDLGDPYKWHNTPYYCPEHDGPAPSFRIRFFRRIARRCYLWFGRPVPPEHRHRLGVVDIDKDIDFKDPYGGNL